MPYQRNNFTKYKMPRVRVRPPEMQQRRMYFLEMVFVRQPLLSLLLLLLLTPTPPLQLLMLLMEYWHDEKSEI